MVSAISSINQYPVDKELLEVVRRLQSLGVAPTGNLVVDRQRLQKAEFQKKQITLASNSEVNLNRIQGSENDFSSTFNGIKNIQTAQKADKVNFNSSFRDNNNSGIAVNLGILNDSDKISSKTRPEMIGASQIAEWNKFELGL